jgi:hypothetical protein
MSQQNQPDPPAARTELETLQDIKKMMERSSRFISLSGLSGIAAGVFALIGAWFAYDHIYEYYANYNENGYEGKEFQKLKLNLLALAAAVLTAALISSFYFTWRRTRHNHLPLWDLTSKRLAINMLIPLITGGLFILAMLQKNLWVYVAPASLIFYGLALVNAGKYTYTDVRYLGYCEIALGLINTQFTGYGLYFWAAGFGVLHIIYGFVMWWKYERKG